MPDSSQEGNESQPVEGGNQQGEAGASAASEPPRPEGSIDGEAQDSSGDSEGGEASESGEEGSDDEAAEQEAAILGVSDEQHLGDTDRGRAANGALRAMSRAARSFLLYDTNNEAILRFLQDYRTEMEVALEFGAVRLEVRPFELVLEGEVVYLDRSRERSLAFRMFRDGVRRLEVEPGVPWSELLKLLEILSVRYTGVRQNEDDIVTLLWKAGFEEIEIVAVEGFVPEEEAEGHYEGSKEAMEVRRASGGAEVPPDWDLPLIPFDDPSEILYEEVPDIVLRGLQEELSSQDLPFHAIRLVTELIDLVVTASDPTELADVIPLVEEVRTFLLSEGQLDGLLAMAQSLVILRSHDAETGDRELTRFADARALRRIIHSASNVSEEVPEELISLLDLVPGNHLDNLLDVLRHERSSASRRIARQLIGRYATTHMESFEQAIKTEEGGVAADVLTAFAEADMSRAIDMVPELLFSTSREVQREVVKILNQVEDGHYSASVLVGMLEAPGEGVRLRLLDMLIATEDPWAYEPLRDRVSDPHAVNWMSEEEAELLGQAMAILDPEASLVLMCDWVRPKKMMDRIKGVTRGRLIQWAGVAGLGLLDDDEAAAAIRWLSERAGANLRSHCLRTLVKRRHHIEGRSSASKPGVATVRDGSEQ